ncbi:MAG: hypothetical protein J6K29_07670 [Clostridia bacterium]|nr:hypothetical protein [Clostridia bacterium]
MEQTKQPKQKPAFFLLRAVIAFVLLFALIAGLYLLAFRGWRDVAEWGKDSNHELLLYEDDTYVLIGIIGKKGLTEKKYPIDKVLGQVKDDGTLMTTEEPTLPADTEEGETIKVTPPDGTPTVPHEHAYILYSVKDMEDHLLVLGKDGAYYLYQLATEETTAPEQDP